MMSNKMTHNGSGHGVVAKFMFVHPGTEAR